MAGLSGLLLYCTQKITKEVFPLKKKIVILLLLSVLCIVYLTACSKDAVVSHYNSALEKIGSRSLTRSGKLQGERRFGIDKYCGEYQADYSGFSGKELLFGGTSLDRSNGSSLEISCRLNSTSGQAKLIFQSGSETEQILTDQTGYYTGTITLPAASNYIAIAGDSFSGSVELDVR